MCQVFSEKQGEGRTFHHQCWGNNCAERKTGAKRIVRFGECACATVQRERDSE